MKIVFATNNEHKLSEIRAILGPSFEVVSLSDIGCHEDIPETGQTLEENALMKAEYVYNKYHLSCFADDTGLEVEALNGAPGVYSARYAALATTPAGSPAGFSLVLANINRNILLQDMPRFVSVMAPDATLILSGFYKTDCALLESKAQELGLSLIDTRYDGDWTCMILKR